MDIGFVLLLVAIAGVVWSLFRGIETMAVAHDVGNLDGERWMVSRVALQAAAIVLLVLLALAR